MPRLLNEEKKVFPRYEKIEYPHAKNEVGPLIYMVNKLNAKWTKDQNVRPKKILKNTKRKHKGKVSYTGLAMISESIHLLCKKDN